MRVKTTISFLIAALFLGLFIWGLTNVSYIYLLAAFIVIALFLYNATRLLGRLHPEKEQRLMKSYLIVMFVFYLFFLFQLTFNVNRTHFMLIFQNKELLRAYLKRNINLIPFKSIIEPFKGGFTISYILVNIFGNIAALAPMGFFLPRLFRPARKLLPFTLITSLVVVFIEFTQFLFTVGSVDIDDLILNVAGAVIVFLFLEIPTIKRTVDKIILRE